MGRSGRRRGWITRLALAACVIALVAPTRAAPVEFSDYRPLDWTKLNDIAVALPEEIGAARRVPSSEYEISEFGYVVRYTGQDLEAGIYVFEVPRLVPPDDIEHPTFQYFWARMYERTLIDAESEDVTLLPDWESAYFGVNRTRFRLSHVVQEAEGLRRHLYHLLTTFDGAFIRIWLDVPDDGEEETRAIGVHEQDRGSVTGRVRPTLAYCSAAAGIDTGTFPPSLRGALRGGDPAPSRPLAGSPQCHPGLDPGSISTLAPASPGSRLSGRDDGEAERSGTHPSTGSG